MVNSKIKLTGFGLIEILIVLTIMVLLMGLAYPSYQSYIENTNQERVKAKLQNLAISIQTQTLNYKKVTNVPISQIGFNSISTDVKPIDNHIIFFPTSNPLYQISIEPVSLQNKIGGHNWKLTATPLDGVFGIKKEEVTIDYQGVMCIINTVKSDCGPRL